MYSYHNTIKKRIKNGELIGYQFVDNYKNIGECLLLFFSTPPFERPIRRISITSMWIFLQNGRERRRDKMREILFRGKRKDNGEWVEGHLLWYEDGRARIIPRHTDIFCYENDENTIQTIAYEVIPETVGQYTGLPDKNSNKIFEGDIAQGNAFGSIWQGEIVWIDEIAGFGIRYFHRSEPTAWENSSILKAMKYKKDIFAAEIIGNIHDKPELLKEADNDKL